jgi:hypothetical protein
LSCSMPIGSGLDEMDHSGRGDADVSLRTTP